VGGSIGCCWVLVSSLIASDSSTTRARFCATAAGASWILPRACLFFAGPPAALGIVSHSYSVHQHRLKCVERTRRAPIARHEVRLSPAPSDRCVRNWGATGTNPRRFGQQLKQSLNKDWLFYYIDYEELKTALRVHHTWDEKSEQSFVEQLEKELDKVYSFVRVKSEEIIRRIAASEKEVNSAVAKSQEHLQSQPANQDGDPFEEDFELLEEDLSDIIADVHDLAKFTQLNYTGFQKIIKKHDVCLCAA
jgi:hypothetical protein